MCGLVAYVTKTMNGASTIDMEMFNAMLYMDALRGWDSTGVASLHTNGDVQVLKEASEAATFIRTKEYIQFCKDFVKNGKAVIGHNRKATIGKIEDETAHPFVIDDKYAFIHNGTLRNHEKLTDEKTDVDSEALGMVLTRCNGDPRLIEKELDNVQGAYACMWLDQEAEKLYVVRNKERPLFIAKTLFGHIIASEFGFIVSAAARANTKIEDNSLKQIPEHTLLTIDLSNHLIEIKEDKLEVKKLVPTTHTVTTITKVSKGGGVANTTSKFQAGNVSKNLFKRIRKHFIGTKIRFWMDDYEAREAGPACDSFDIVGSVPDELKFDHKITGRIEGMDETTLIWVVDSVPLYGTIADVLYDQKEQKIIFQVGIATLATPSVASAAVSTPNWTQ